MTAFEYHIWTKLDGACMAGLICVMLVYVRTCWCMYMLVRVHVYVDVRVHVYVGTCICTCWYTFVHVYVGTCMCTYWCVCKKQVVVAN